LGFWLIRGSALGPIGGLSTRQFNSCLPHIEDEDDEERYFFNIQDNEQRPFKKIVFGHNSAADLSDFSEILHREAKYMAIEVT